MSVGHHFNRDHGTIMHGVKKLRSLTDDDWQIKAYKEEIEKELCQ